MSSNLSQQTVLLTDGVPFSVPVKNIYNDYQIYMENPSSSVGYVELEGKSPHSSQYSKVREVNGKSTKFYMDDPRMVVIKDIRLGSLRFIPVGFTGTVTIKVESTELQ